MKNEDTICAISTPPGNGAIAVIRLSGPEAIAIADSIFHSGAGKKKLASQQANTIHFGYIKDDEEIIDEVLVSLFKSPNSYTGEDLVEISCHGSEFIQEKLVQVFKTKTQKEWSEVMEGSDVCFAPVLSLEEAPKHPHNVARKTFVEHDGVLQTAPAPRFSRTKAELQRPPPQPGEHTESALHDWGFSPAEKGEHGTAGATRFKKTGGTPCPQSLASSNDFTSHFTTPFAATRVQTPLPVAPRFRPRPDCSPVRTSDRRPGRT